MVQGPKVRWHPPALPSMVWVPGFAGRCFPPPLWYDSQNSSLQGILFYCDSLPSIRFLGLSIICLCHSFRIAFRLRFLCFLKEKAMKRNPAAPTTTRKEGNQRASRSHNQRASRSRNHSRGYCSSAQVCFPCSQATNPHDPHGKGWEAGTESGGIRLQQ